jgi:hypothetical protein
MAPQRSNGSKTDHIDAKRLLRSLMAYLRGEPKVWSVVRVPSVAEEDDRRLHRERDRLIAERGQHVNRIKGLCAIHGIYDYEPMRRDRMLRLEQLHTGDGRELPLRLKAEIARELQRLELILGMLKEIEAERDAIALTENVSAHTNAKTIQNLVKLKAIGAEIATVVTGEVFYRPFNNRHMRRRVMWPSGARCSRRNSAKLSLATIRCLCCGLWRRQDSVGYIASATLQRWVLCCEPSPPSTRQGKTVREIEMAFGKILFACIVGSVTLLNALVASAVADNCKEPKTDTREVPVFSPPLANVVTGTGRLQFHSAPNTRCVMSGVFVIPE